MYEQRCSALAGPRWTQHGAKLLSFKFRVSAKVVFGPDAVAQLPAELAMHDGCTPTNPHPIDETGFSALFAQGLDGGMS